MDKGENHSTEPNAEKVEATKLKQVQVPCVRRNVTLYLTTPSRLGILQSEAGNKDAIRAKTGRHTGVNEGMTWVKRFYKNVLRLRLNLNNKMSTSPSNLTAFT